MPNNLDSLAADLGQKLLARGWVVTTAESCTGGGVAHAITSVAGSSAWFERGYVTYSNKAKTEMLGVPLSLIESFGAVSQQVVEAMATGARSLAGADIAVAISGIAGPDGGTPEKPVGTVWFAWSCSERVVSGFHLLPGDRVAVRRAALEIALAGLIDMTTNTV
jgi:nicotinamide-nucleotide amidase